MNKTYTVKKDPVNNDVFFTTDGSGGYEDVEPDRLTKICDTILNHEPVNSFYDDKKDFYRNVLQFSDFFVAVDYPNMKVFNDADYRDYPPLAGANKFLDQARAICYSIGVDKMFDEQMQEQARKSEMQKSTDDVKDKNEFMTDADENKEEGDGFKN